LHILKQSKQGSQIFWLPFLFSNKFYDMQFSIFLFNFLKKKKILQNIFLFKSHSNKGI